MCQAKTRLSINLLISERRQRAVSRAAGTDCFDLGEDAQRRQFSVTRHNLYKGSCLEEEGGAGVKRSNSKGQTGRYANCDSLSSGS
jgi:hypothetical protein